MLDAALVHADIAEDALAGLRARPKTLPSKLFYDAEGVRLFGQITGLPEYYLTRTECAMLARLAPEILASVPPGSALVEYGASDEAKAALLLDAAADRIAAYVPVDVAADALGALRARLRRSHPALAVHAMVADFQQPLDLPGSVSGMPRFGFFPGSTIGNLDPPAARGFLRTVRRTLGDGAQLLLGADLRKEASTLIAAYDDAAGVTAAFNLNLLHRLNRELAADFDPAAFAHEARWNPADGRIEMHLRSLRPQRVHVLGEVLRFAEGETIHTENSHKYTLDGLRALARAGQWDLVRSWTDPDGLYALVLLDAART